MRKNKKIKVISNVNDTLEEFYKTFSNSEEDIKIKKVIAKAYVIINRQESVRDQYDAVGWGLDLINSYLRYIALKRKRPFTKEQNELIHKYNDQYAPTLLQSMGMIFNAQSFISSFLKYC